MTTFTVNGRSVDVAAEPDTPLLWVVREHLKLYGTKFGCGIAQCGACTVHLDGEPVRSCQTTLEAAAGRQVTTIEGLSHDASHPVQKAWLAEQVPACGYCQSGQIMEAAAFLAKHPKPTRADIVKAMDGHICRCGTYPRIIRAIERAAHGSGEATQMQGQHASADTQSGRTGQ
ncbi:MAG TPA: (2Fe-2S)-binding protein [Stellaceae bacterium]|nr:(2Fe-2S)-binding protein [Stellaceae bacterium]